MLGNHFYHSTIKRAVSVFGTLFNNITIKRTDGKIIPVPLAYGPRQRWIARLQNTPDPSAKAIAITLPRMGFEMTSIEYDASRKLNKKTHFRSADSSNPNKMQKQFSPAPYNIGFTLSILVKNTDDGLQIIEQILPYFTPDYTVTIHTVPSMDDKRDIPIILTSVSQEDTYEGDLETRQSLTYTLEFTMKNYIYGPVQSSEIIRKANVRTYMEGGVGEISDVESAGKVVDQKIEPIPSDAAPDDDITYNETTSWFEQPNVTYSDDKSSDPK